MLSQRGWSLIELMISLSLGLIVTGGALGLLMATWVTQRDAIDQARLNQEVRHLANSMRRDFMRAGFWQVTESVVRVSSRCDLEVQNSAAGTATLNAVLPNSSAPCTAFGAPLSSAVLVGRNLLISRLDAHGQPEMGSLRIEAVMDARRVLVSTVGALSASRIAAGSWTIGNPFSMSVQAGDCLVFGYDEDADGQRGDQEWFGYRMDQSAHAVRGVNNARSCSSGDWENISDERVVYVSELIFSLPSVVLQPSTEMGFRRYSATFRMEARLRRDSRMDRKIETRVRVRNDAQAW